MDVYGYERSCLRCCIGQRQYQSGGQLAGRRVSHLYGGGHDQSKRHGKPVQYGNGDTTVGFARYRTGQQLGDGYGYADCTGAYSNADTDTDIDANPDANTDTDANTGRGFRGRH